MAIGEEYEFIPPAYAFPVPVREVSLVSEPEDETPPSPISTLDVAPAKAMSLLHLSNFNERINESMPSYRLC